MEQIGTAPSGLGVYRFQYVACAGIPGTHIGALAQEVMAVCPAAVELQADGFYAVDYGMIDVPSLRIVD